MRFQAFVALALYHLTQSPLAEGSDIIEDPMDLDLVQDSLNADWDDSLFWEEFEDTEADRPLVDNSNKESQDVDIDMEGPCKADLDGHKECATGRDKGVCLWMSAVDTARWMNRYGSSDWYKPLSSECKEYLVDFLTDASSHPLEYFHDLKVECSSDLAAFCADKIGTTALSCLRAHFDSIQQQGCRDEITQLNSWASLNAAWWSPTLWKDCIEERKGVCSGSTSTGLSDFRDCLDANRETISEACHNSLFQSDLQAAPSPFYMRQNVGTKCKTESKEYCSDVVMNDENKLFCLFRASKRHSDRFDPDCATAVEDIVKVLESDYRLNVPIRKFCRRTINDFCHEEKQRNDKKAHESDEVIDCLKRVYLYNEHRQRQNGETDWRHYEETEACMHAVRQSVLIDSLDWEVDSSLHANCFQDYHKLLQRIKSNDVTLRDHDSCSGETPNECLQSHFHDISNQECKKAVALHSQLSALDQDFKPQLLKACALALDDLDCSGFEQSGDHHVGKDGMVQCLYSYLARISDQHCRGAIRHDYQLSERDFRLSYELSLVCANDRASLCGKETPELVLKCMIDNEEKIEDAECHKDVSRLSFVAMSEGQDVMEKSVCSKDVEKLCRSSPSGAHGTIHSCLLNSMNELSQDCAESVLNLHKSASSVEAMEKLLNSACSEVLVSDRCSHLIQKTADHSLTAKVDCIEDVLYESRDSTRVSPECETQVTAVQSLLSADYRTNPELQRDCSTDVSLLCATERDRLASTKTFSTELIQCLVQQRTKIRNSHCKKHIVHFVYKMSDDVVYVPNMRSVCGDDLKKFCSGIQPGNGQLHQCLRSNMEQLTHDCQSQEFAIEQIEDIAASTRRACSVDLGSICKQSQTLHCLWRNVDDTQSECQTAVKREMKGKIGNIWLDATMYTKCRLSVNSLIESGADKCPSYLVKLPASLNGQIPLPSNYTQAIGGEHVTCLGTNRAKIADATCLNLVEDLLRMEIKDPVLLRFGLRKACKSELKVGGVCGEADPFETLDQWKCLQDSVVKELTTSACTDSVKRIWRLSLVDIKFNPDISANCEVEVSDQCGGNHGTRVLVCLRDLLNGDSKDTISESCSEAIKRMPAPEAAGIEDKWNKERLNFERNSDDAEPEEVRMLKQRPEDRPDVSVASLSLTGPLAFVSLASLFIVIGASVYRLYRYKMNKGYMVIVDKH